MTSATGETVERQRLGTRGADVEHRGRQPQMRQEPLEQRGIFDQGDQPEAPATPGTGEHLNDKIQILSEADFIGDRDTLIRALDRLQFGNPTQPYDAIGASIEGGKVVLVFTHDEVSQHAIGWRNVLDKTRVDGLMIYTISRESDYRLVQ